MRSRAHFKIEFETAVSAAAETVYCTGREADVLAFANANLQPNVGFLVACLADGVDFGNLIIEVDDQGRCNLRALEHRGFFVRDVSLEQAISALAYWLPSQDRAPNLKWQDE
jgi:hypothetical protein